MCKKEIFSLLVIEGQDVLNEIGFVSQFWPFNAKARRCEDAKKGLERPYRAQWGNGDDVPRDMPSATMVQAFGLTALR